MIFVIKSYSEWLNNHILKRKGIRYLQGAYMLCYLCRMKKMMMIAAGAVLTATPIFAQFNTVVPDIVTVVSETVPVKENNLENLHGKYSRSDGPSGKRNIPASQNAAEKDIWVRRYLSVSYPLRKMKINSTYGYRTDPFTGKRKFHNGIDLHARGDEALAMMEGTVIRVGQERISGKYVVLRHGEFTVSYCHLSRILVCKGVAVRPRDAVGITGSTGRSTGEHLHITCRRNGKNVDPTEIFNYIKATQEKCVAVLAGMP